MMRYFLKELLSNKLYLPNGARVQFEDAGDDTGILATQDAYVISELDRAIQRQVGGVSSIDQAQYEDLKKNPRKPARSLNYNDAREMQVVVRQLQQQLAAAQAAAAGGSIKPQPAVPPPGQTSAPIHVPTSIPRPPTRRARSSAPSVVDSLAVSDSVELALTRATP